MTEQDEHVLVRVIEELKLSMDKLLKEIQPARSRQKKFTPPTKNEFRDYCKEKGFGHIADRAYEYYNSNDWRDSHGDKIRNWKQKLIGVWFDEKKNPKPAQFQESKYERL
jgi:hypothetical protein